jgi:hypothetical protein
LNNFTSPASKKDSRIALMGFILKFRLGIIDKKLIFIKFWELFISIYLFLHLFHMRFTDFYSAHAQNKDAYRIFYFSKSTCPIRKVYKSNYFLLFIIFVFEFWNSSYCISLKSNPMSWKCNNIDCIRIISDSSTSLYHIFKFV